MRPSAASRWTRPVVVVPAFVVVSLVGGALPSFSGAAGLLVLGSGAVLLGLGFSRRVPRRRPAPEALTAGAAWWLLPALGFALVEIVDFALGSGPAHPTLSTLADPYLTHYAIRAAAYLGWLTAFWGLARR